MNSVRSNNVSLKYQRFATLGSKNIGILNSEFVAKTQFLYLEYLMIKNAWQGWSVFVKNHSLASQSSPESF